MEIRLWRELLIPYELAVKELVMKFNQLKKEHKEKEDYYWFGFGDYLSACCIGSYRICHHPQFLQGE